MRIDEQLTASLRTFENLINKKYNYEFQMQKKPYVNTRFEIHLDGYRNKIYRSFNLYIKKIEHEFRLSKSIWLKLIFDDWTLTIVV